MIDFDAARKNMVDCQLRTNGIVDERVLAAMATVPREAFVPEAVRPIAYADEDIDLGDGDSLIEPLVLARLLQMVNGTTDDAALVVGCGGGGYVAAVLSQLASSVVVVGSDAGRVQAATANLSAQDFNNIVVVEGALADGYPAQAPYDVIVISGAVAEVPMPIAEQLDEGGRLACVVDGPCEGLGRAVLVTRQHGVLSERAMHDASIPLLPEFARQESFVF